MDELLPKELLIEIFDYLRFNDLCQLTLTCKLFNEIISNSSTLMDKFRLVYKKTNNINVDLMMKRKYRTISIRTINESLFKLLQFYGDNISAWNIKCDEIAIQDFRRILILCPKVTRLIIYVEKFTYSDEDFTKPVLKLTLDSITIHICDYTILKILQISAKNIRVYIKCYDSPSKNALVNFLKNQKHLKTLQLRGNSYELFDDDSLVDVDFQLETLAVDFNFSSPSSEFLKKFLGNQKSLWRIHYNKEFCSPLESDYPNIVRYFQNVTDLEIPSPCDFSHPLPRIEKLSICIFECTENFRNFSEIFPNVKNLSIRCTRCKIKFVENFTESASEDCVEFKISENVKTLTVSLLKSGNDGPFDDDVEIKIENLTIDRIDSIKWLIDCFKNDRIKLKSLTIVNTRMKKSQREFLESLTCGENKKIEKLKICMPMKFYESREYVCDYLMENESVGAKRIKLS